MYHHDTTYDSLPIIKLKPPAIAGKCLVCDGWFRQSQSYKQIILVVSLGGYKINTLMINMFFNMLVLMFDSCDSANP